MQRCKPDPSTAPPRASAAGVASRSTRVTAGMSLRTGVERRRLIAASGSEEFICHIERWRLLARSKKANRRQQRCRRHSSAVLQQG
jgi:hypothetical protein